ncbi:MAG: PExPT-CTERM protein [Acidobacteriaceae bacterium]|nr:PExPT-CTERM protein [Acidobacteriaceae bacterium]
MKKIFLYTCMAIVLGAAARPALAQDGCDNSPENPTVILAGLAGGVYGLNTLRTRFRARKK